VASGRRRCPLFSHVSEFALSRMDCIVCGEGEWELRLRGVRDYITAETFDVARCRRCGLGMTQPMPSNPHLERYYPRRYRVRRHRFTRGMRVLLRRRALERWFAPGFHGRLLDLGCGDGAFALAQRRRGWAVSGTELDPRTVDDLRAKGLDAYTHGAAMRELSGPFDAITCWHVLEHLQDPSTLAWARQLLAPSGIFQVTVPNWSAWQARLHGATWLHLDVPRHRYHFAPETLRQVLVRAGFRWVRETTFALEYDWFGMIQSVLNGVCSRPNVLFECLTSPRDPPQRPAFAPSDLALSWLLAPVAAALSLPFCLVAWAAGRGATLTVTCRPR